MLLPMNAFATYIESTGLRQTKVSEALGISNGHTSRLANGVEVPGLALAVKIEKWSGGAVPPASWFPAYSDE